MDKICCLCKGKAHENSVKQVMVGFSDFSKRHDVADRRTFDEVISAPTEEIKHFRNKLPRLGLRGSAHVGVWGYY